MMKNYDKLTFTDDFLFCRIMQENPDLCRDLVELVLGRRIGRIVQGPEKQKPITVTADGKGIRLDVCFEDDSRMVYDIEMQTFQSYDPAKRARYYQAMLDISSPERRENYAEPKDCYIVFICTFDALHRYTLTTQCMEDPESGFDDGARKVFLCPGGSAEDISEELEAFLDYISGKAAGTDLVKRIDCEVDKARNHLEWRDEYMSLYLRDLENRKIGRQEGILEGQQMLEQLLWFLIDSGRSDEIPAVISDRAYIEALFSEFGITGSEHDPDISNRCNDES